MGNKKQNRLERTRKDARTKRRTPLKVIDILLG